MRKEVFIEFFEFLADDHGAVVSWGMGNGKTPVHFNSTPVVLMESFTYGKCLNLSMLLLCLCCAITSSLQSAAQLRSQACGFLKFVP